MKRVILLILRLIYGRFSYVFQQYGIGLKTRNLTRQKYFLACAGLDALNHYKGAIQPSDKISVFNTDKRIDFQNNKFGITFRSLLRKNKRYSCYDITKYLDFYWQRLGYRERVFNTGIRFIYHFIDKKFFFGEMFFSDATKVNVEQVAASLIKKYTNQMVSTTETFKIMAKNGFIFFENTGINLSIKYIDTTNDFINKALETICDLNLSENVIIKNNLEDLL